MPQHASFTAPAAMQQAIAGKRRWVVRRLKGFDEAEALALATPGEAQRLHRLQALVIQARLNALNRPGFWQAHPLPLLVLDDNARPVMMWPLLHWLPPQSARFGLRGIATLACTDGPPALLLPGLASLSLTALQGRSLLAAVRSALPAAVDLFLCHALPPILPAGQEMPGTALSGHWPALSLPGCRAVHFTGWRGLALLPQLWLRHPDAGMNMRS